MKSKTLLVIVLVKFIYFVRSFSSKEVTPKLELGNKCAALPAVSDSSLEKLIKKKCYIDKTEYLYKMVQENETQIFWFLARPRRFGKTLLINVLEALFTGRQEFFKNTAIYQHIINLYSNFKIKTIHWPEYPVIRLDFSDGISTDSYSEFKQDMITKLRQIAESHKIPLIASSVPSVLEELIKKMNDKYNKTVVVLVDEYDLPYTEVYKANKGEASLVLRTLQSFFMTLKSCSKHIRFSFTTGITRLALSNFFSGANAEVDLTMDPDYAGILGFTENELTQYFGGFIEKIAKEKGNTTTDIVGVMRKWHNGFQFTEKNESLYNPISVIGYLKSKGDVHSWTDTGAGSGFFVQKLKSFPKYAMKLFLHCAVYDQSDESTEEYKVTAKRSELTGKFNYDESTNPSALKVLLFHNGYLSIKSYDTMTRSFTLKFSNLEVKEDYAMRLYCSFSGKDHTDMEEKINSMVQKLDESKWESFISRLNSLKNSIPYFLNVNQRTGREAWFQFIMYIMFHFSTYPRKGKPSWEDPTSKGRADITLPMNNKIYIFEPKEVSNPENPVYECKVKYPHQHFFSKEVEEVSCLGLQFSPDGTVRSWGVAKFSREGKLIEEGGNITLTNQLNPEETQKITNILTDFKKKDSKFTLQRDKLIEFLEQIGPTPKEELSFADDYTTDIKTFCTLLSEIKKELRPNLKSIIFGFLKRHAPKKEKEEKGTPTNRSIRSRKN